VVLVQLGKMASQEVVAMEELDFLIQYLALILDMPAAVVVSDILIVGRGQLQMVELLEVHQQEEMQVLEQIIEVAAAELVKDIFLADLEALV